MYKRDWVPFLREKASQYPILTLIGPRQAGKSTLCRSVFPDYIYVTLEDGDTRSLAQQDPRGFFKKYPSPLIIDEIQRAPDLLSYLQTLVDEPGTGRSFVLTGSHQLLLMEKVAQTLAGRTYIAKLLPFSHQELLQKESSRFSDVDDYLFSGGYPRIYDKNIPPNEWLSQYYQTYVERDVRQILNITDLDLFDRFVRLCAGRVGQIWEASSLSRDCGISVPTAASWLSVLKASFICFTLQPHFRNFNKRLIKNPKLYFYDTGLVCYLLQIRTKDILQNHPLRGNIFENWVVAEKLKQAYHHGVEPAYYYWRDHKGHEVDLIEDRSTYLYPVEIKSGATFHADFLKDVNYLNALQESSLTQGESGACIYGGDSSFEFKGFKVVSWKEI